MPLDPEQFADAVAAAIETATAPLLARIQVLEKGSLPGRDGLPGVPGNNGKDGRDGKDADPAVIAKLQDEIDGLRAQLAEAKAQPEPVDVTPVIQQRVESEVKALRSDLASMVTDRLAVAVANLPSPERGKDGTSVTPEDVVPLVAAEVAKAVAALPPAKAGQDGQSVTVDDVAPMVAEVVQKAVASLPVPQNGKDGKDIDPAAVEDMVADWVTRAVAALPKPKDGSDGQSVTVEDVKPLIDSAVEKAVKALPSPVGFAGAMVDRSGHLVLTMTDGTTKDIGAVVGADGRDVDMASVERLVEAAVAALPPPKDGKPGRDGTLEGLKAVYDGERTITLCFKDGTPIEGGVIVLPVVIDRGVYAPGRSYDKGDGATWGGSFWIAQEATTAKPGETKAWRLAVKKGTDGKSGPEGKQGPIGPKGDPGPIGPARY